MENLMPIKKLTLSVDAQIIENARIYSKEHKTSISRLVSGFLSQLAESDEQTTPRVRRLMGLLPPDIDEEEYHRHLDEKYHP
jgi:hypothetical protein